MMDFQMPEEELQKIREAIDYTMKNWKPEQDKKEVEVPLEGQNH